MAARFLLRVWPLPGYPGTALVPVAQHSVRAAGSTVRALRQRCDGSVVLAVESEAEAGLTLRMPPATVSSYLLLADDGNACACYMRSPCTCFPR